jgi:3-methyl-2-oxobutanoate hydroxymethyltransferase
MVTAYDFPSARLANEAGVDLILVGDSVGTTVMGLDSTLEVDLNAMVHHTRAVARAKPEALVVADMPWLTYHVGSKRAVKSAGKLIKAGANAVKLEGGSARKKAIKAILSSEIPVMGHLGLTPQSVNAFGGMAVQGRSVEAAKQIIDDAKLLAELGVFALVLEGLPAELAAVITDQIPIPTIGIGAGIGCDGQVLVFHDLLQLAAGKPAKFVKSYANIGEEITSALERYVKDVQTLQYPDEEHSYRTPDDLARWLTGLR